MEDCVSGAVWKMATRQTKLSVADWQTTSQIGRGWRWTERSVRERTVEDSVIVCPLERRLLTREREENDVRLVRWDGRWPGADEANQYVEWMRGQGHVQTDRRRRRRGGLGRAVLTVEDWRLTKLDCKQCIWRLGGFCQCLMPMVALRNSIFC